MRGISLPVIIILGILLILIFMGCGQYNTLVQKDENVKKVWNNVQSQYQRRADLIPNLVNTVRGEANFERGTLNDVINARARATSMQISPENLTAENIERFQQAQGQLSSSLSRLLVTVEQYPNLRANDAFRNLQTQLEGTENRIAVARNDFNASVQDYNTTVRRFPTNIFAGMMGFPPRTGFTADPGSQNAPRVDFGDQQPARPQVNFNDTSRR
ncbi:MAG: LemA family protein [Flavisolibacter sp.]|nr:LemA family protein [Flavisolibacter sp.]MBD0287412.1 LemA family protein [Flavisolibacter sp.]MBD0295181.1 LemA family protein [Flavisolibacter sp.]MBD0352258.1 LemA family protein [Flavisolibacter sp.]MBD0368283.1 LemA family protein [Flavisolibacter sp.]